MLVIRLASSQWESISKSFVSSSHHATKRFGIDPKLPTSSIYNHIFPTRERNNAVRLFINPKVTLVPVFYNQCNRCYSQDIRFTASTAVCMGCGEEIISQLESNETSYAESHGGAWFNPMSYQANGPRAFSVSYTKRLNHFKYWIARLQGQENVTIEQDQLDTIKRKLGSYCDFEITFESVKRILKSLRLQRYYNNIFTIMRILGRPPLVEFESNHEEKLCEMFIAIQQPFQIESNGRANMISYPYIIKKFCELLGWWDISRHIHCLKNDKKTAELDKIWKRVCVRLGFRFIRTF